jgi:uncharacterized protein YcbK (DUF882 family)
MLSEHFSREEMACRHCGKLPKQGISQALLDGLEKLRTAIGNKPINVSSGYRCPVRNMEVDGVPNSDHMKGKAADICVPGMNVYKLADLCLEIFDGVGIYEEDDFVHVDMRSDGTEVGKYLWFK